MTMKELEKTYKKMKKAKLFELLKEFCEFSLNAIELIKIKNKKIEELKKENERLNRYIENDRILIDYYKNLI